jgi:hypothetical protein
MSADSQAVARFVTATMGLVIGLTFLFGFGNVLNLALKLQVPALVAPLVASAVDLTVLGLLVGTRHLALSGADDDVLRPARRLLLASSAVTLLLNIADPVSVGQWGKAAFDSVGPLLLIGWAEAGPGLLRALSAVSDDLGSAQSSVSSSAGPVGGTMKQQTGHSTVQRDMEVAAATRGTTGSTTNSWSGRARRTRNTGDATSALSPRRPCGSTFASARRLRGLS